MLDETLERTKQRSGGGGGRRAGGGGGGGDGGARGDGGGGGGDGGDGKERRTLSTFTFGAASGSASGSLPAAAAGNPYAAYSSALAPSEVAAVGGKETAALVTRLRVAYHRDYAMFSQVSMGS